VRYLSSPVVLAVLTHRHPRDEDNFLYVSYSGENTFGVDGWVEIPADA
jgi:hypothetical protein